MFNEARVFLHPRVAIVRAMERIYQYRMTTTSGGNISIREKNGDLWITPARVDKGNLQQSDIVCIRADGRVEGEHPPSLELPLHQAVYAARPELTALVHAHSVALVAFSMVRRAPETRMFYQAHCVCGEAGFVQYALPGSTELGQNTAEVFRQGHHCAVLESHGVITGGVTLDQAFRRFETLEFAARAMIKAKQVGEIYLLNEEELKIAESGPPELPVRDRRDPDSREADVRHMICEFVRRAYRQRLFISTQGCFSVRLDDHSFLITPVRVDRAKLQPEDIVLVTDGNAEPGVIPSRVVTVHLAIYHKHPDVGAVINAYPVNATAFSVTREHLDSRTIPESYLVLQNVGRAPYGVQFTDPDAIADLVKPEQPCVLMKNDGVVVTGNDALQAFDRLEVLEATAEALIQARVAGVMAPLNEDRIRELDAAFFTNRTASGLS